MNETKKKKKEVKVKTEPLGIEVIIRKFSSTLEAKDDEKEEQ